MRDTLGTVFQHQADTVAYTDRDGDHYCVPCVEAYLTTSDMVGAKARTQKSLDNSNDEYGTRCQACHKDLSR